MRVVTSSASRLLIHDMVSMPSILPLRVHRAKTLIAQNAVAVMTLIAERITADAFRSAIRQQQLTLQNRRVNRAMRSVRPGTAPLRPLIIIMTVRAINPARRRQRRNQAGDICVLPDRFNRVIRDIRGIKLIPFVGLNNLPVHMCRATPDTVRVTAETKFVLGIERIHNRARGVNPFHASQSA